MLVLFSHFKVFLLYYAMKLAFNIMRWQTQTMTHFSGTLNPYPANVENMVSS